MKPEDWIVDPGVALGVIRLGATREELANSLTGIGVELDVDDEDDWLYVPEMDTELHFKSTRPPALLEIVAEDERVRLGPLPVIGERLHKIVDLLQVPDAETVWRTHETADEERTDANRPIMTDNTLLDRGTLWIPSLGLGLGMVRGEITTVRLRKPEESPRRGYGMLTPAQRELSARNDLMTYLIRRNSNGPSTWESRLLTILGFGVALMIGMLVWQGIAYQGQWNSAPVVEGEVIGVEPPPPEPFPDEYTIDYRDSAGNSHQVVFKRNDVYVTPKIGEKVEIRFLPDAPDRPLGPARYRDAAFDRYLPLGIGVVAAYFISVLVVPVIGMFCRRLGRQRLEGKPDQTLV